MKNIENLMQLCHNSLLAKQYEIPFLDLVQSRLDSASGYIPCANLTTLVPFGRLYNFQLPKGNSSGIEEFHSLYLFCLKWTIPSKIEISSSK